MGVADERSLSRVDVSVKLISDFFDHVTDAQEAACAGELDVARVLLKAALRDLSTCEALVQAVLDDLTTFERIAEFL